MSPAIQPASYRFLQDCVYRDSGIVLDNGKQYLLEARLLPIARQLQLASLDDLCRMLNDSRHAAVRRQVIEAMTTNETFFFRDPAQYDALRNCVIPALVAQRGDTRKMSFWSAAASSGQEAYSLAMLLLEMGLGDWRIQIQGTDLSSRMVERANAGKYLQIEVNRGLPASYLVKYFTRDGLEWQIKDQVRRMAEFTTFDLRRSLSARGPFDVVFCRNVLIYFDLESKRKILDEIHGTLYRGGYLLLGGSETTLNLTNRFERRLIGQTVLYQSP